MARGHRFPDDAFPIVVAHRGASSTRPENTIPSFEEAIRLGAGIIEFDVRLSRDGVPVVIHDLAVDRTTGGTGLVHELGAAELSSLNAGTEAEPTPVPTLAEVLRCVSGRAAIAVEIKNIPGEPAFEPTTEPIVEAVHAELERQGFDGAVLVISFNPSSIAASKLVAPDVPTGFLTTDLVPPREALAYAASAGHDMVLPGTRASIPAGPSFVDEVHAAGLRLGTWTVDDPETVRMLLDRGFDAVASNDPKMALAVLADHVAFVSLRRRRLPEHLEGPAKAFDDLLPPLGRAEAALTGSVPGTRLPGRPLAETLWEFEDGLREVRDGMDAWRSPDIEPEWEACSRGLDDALALADRVRTEGVQPEGFEGLIGLIGDLLAPLDAFELASARFRELRR